MDENIRIGQILNEIQVLEEYVKEIDRSAKSQKRSNIFLILFFLSLLLVGVMLKIPWVLIFIFPMIAYYVHDKKKYEIKNPTQKKLEANMKIAELRTELQKMTF